MEWGEVARVGGPVTLLAVFSLSLMWRIQMRLLDGMAELREAIRELSRAIHERKL